MNRNTLDPILLTVITNRLESIAREMGAGMLRGSRSPIFAETKDFATAIFDSQLRLVGQTAYIPVLMGGSPIAVRSISKHFNKNIYKGDVFVLNDPYHGNSHLPDITVVKPVFIENRPWFWVLARGHHADIGGGGTAGYNPNARTIWEEGIRIPPCKLYRQGVYNQDIWNLILLNVRLPELVESDLQCQVGACHLGEKALLQLLHQYGRQNTQTVIEEMLKRSREQMQSCIQDLPNGIYHSERQLDHLLDDSKDTRPTIRLQLEAKKNRLIFDFSKSDSQIPAYYNSSYSNTVSSCYIGLFSTIAADIKVNEGSTQPIDVIAPEGSLLNPKEGAPTTQCTVATCAAIVESVWLALSQAVPKLVQAGWARSPSGVGTSLNPKTERYAAFIFKFTKGGGGATFGFDGWSHISPVSSMGGARVSDVELHELSFPHRILTYEYRKDSAGAGKWRGGYGAHFRLQFIEDGTTLSVQPGSDHEITSPFGLEEGQNAPPGSINIKQKNGKTIPFKKATLCKPKKGDIVEFLSSGGGGYGNPYERPVDAIMKDVTAGLLSTEKALQEYGVIIDPQTLIVDLEATKKRRQNRPKL